jgi:hypothetical protein
MKTKSDTVFYFDYENEPIGGSNPYYRCVHCGISDPQINGRLEGHADYSIEGSNTETDSPIVWFDIKATKKCDGC